MKNTLVWLLLMLGAAIASWWRSTRVKIENIPFGTADWAEVEAVDASCRSGLACLGKKDGFLSRPCFPTN